MTTHPAAPRRSQAERSSATRQALIDATIACLVEDGYANTTTGRVPNAPASRAGRICTTSRPVRRWSPRRPSSSRCAAASSAEPPPTGCRPAASAWPRASTCCGRRMPTRSTRRRLTCGPTRAPTRSCARCSSTSSACSTARRSRSRARCSRELAATRDFERLIEMALATARGLALLDTLHPGDAAIASSGRTAARSSSSCSRRPPSSFRGPRPRCGPARRRSSPRSSRAR